MQSIIVICSHIRDVHSQKTRTVRMMDDGKIISLRMGNEELQEMDAYLQDHPELGGRSLFIRTAIREYIDRDADVPQTRNGNEVAVRLANAEIDTIDSMVQDGIYIDRSDAIRQLLREQIVDREMMTELARSKHSAASSQTR